MFRKVNMKWLGVIFLVLLALFIFIQVRETRKGDRSFRKFLVEADTASMAAIHIVRPGTHGAKLDLYRKDSGWEVSSGNETYKADDNAVENLLLQLKSLSPERVAATKSDKWATYEVVDTMAVEVKVLNKKDRVLSDLLIGKFSYKQPDNPYSRQGTMTSFVREKGEKKVYAVNGFLKMTFNADLATYRYKALVNGSPENWTKLAFNYPADSSFVMTRDSLGWTIDGQLADSLKTVQFLNVLHNLSGHNFVNKSVIKSETPAFSLNIQGVNPVAITALPADSVNGYAIHSTLNADAYFSGNGGDLMNRVFKGKEYFFKK